MMPMPLRPQSPMQPRYSPRMMPQRYHGQMPYGQFNYHPQMQMQMPMQRPMMRNGGKKEGGLLAKILGRGNQQAGVSGIMPSMNRSASSGGAGILKSLANPDTLNGFLNNTQTVLKTAQQLGPVFQQYGPLVRNLPSLWKLYRGLKDATSDTEENENTTETETESNQMESLDDNELIEIDPIVDEKKTSRSSKNKTKNVAVEGNHSTFNKNNRSVPKLYI